MAIDSVLNPAGIAQKLSVQQLQKAIQDGTIPPYIGVPMLQQKVQMEQRMRNASAQPQQGQPSIAQQVMSEAQGVGQLPSNLPQQYAGGGIVAFARGGIPDIEADQFDEDSEDELNDEVNRLMRQMQAMQERAIESSAGMETPAGVEIFPRSVTPTGFTSTEIKKGVSVKEGDQPPRTVEERQKSVTKPAGLEDLLAQIEQKESGGRRYGKDGQLLTSPKGALGEMQVMPATARDPGFGIRPAEGQNPDELRRVGREYYGKLLEKYGDPKLAAIAYNMGPGATDKWMMSGADPSRLPDETRKYAQGFAEGGITRLQVGGSALVPYSYPSVSSLDPFDWEARKMAEDIAKKRGYGLTPEEFKDLAQRRLRMEQARSAFSAAPEFAPGTPAPSAPASPASPASPADERSLLRKASEAGGRGIGSFFGDLMRTGPLARSLGVGAFLTPITANANEEEELARRSQMPPTITTTEKLRPMAPPSTSGKPAVILPPSSAGAGRGIQGGPTAGELDAYAKDLEIGASQDFEDLERGLGMTAMARDAQLEKEAASKKPGIAEDDELKDLRDRIKKGYAKLDKQAESDKYLALLSAGLGIMSGTSPFALSNIGKGGMMGVQSLLQSDASRAAQEAKLMNAQLYAKRYGQLGDIQKAQLEATQAFRESETQRKREASEAAIEARKASLLQTAKKNDEDLLNKLETEANRIVESSGKLATLETLGKSSEEIAQMKRRMVDDLLAQNKRYQAIQSRLYPGMKESFGGSSVLSYDPKTKSLIRP